MVISIAKGPDALRGKIMSANQLLNTFFIVSSQANKIKWLEKVNLWQMANALILSMRILFR